MQSFENRTQFLIVSNIAFQYVEIGVVDCFAHLSLGVDIDHVKVGHSYIKIAWKNHHSAYFAFSF